MDYNYSEEQMELEAQAREADRRKALNKRILYALVLVLACTLTWFFTRSYYKIKDGMGFNYESLSEVISDEEALEKFVEQIAVFKQYFYFDATDEQLMEGALRGMASYLGDPYTTYFSKEELESYNAEMDGSYVGIGVSVTMGTDNMVTILKVFPDSPAEKAGMMKGDKFLKVGDVDVTSGYDTNEIVTLIKGEPDTTVNITFYRPSTEETFAKDVQRKQITNYNVTYEMLESNVGYLQIDSFDATVDTQFEKAMSELIKAGAQGIVIDLRDNGGGYLQQTLNMCDTLVAKNDVMLTLKYANNQEDVYKSWSNPKYEGIELVVLVNEYSASASEVFTGVLKDSGRAKVVGVTTFGKGIVQTMYTYDDGSAIKLTTASYFTPGGYEIHSNGITPDVVEAIDPEYELYSPSVIPEGCDNQLNKAVEVLKGMINE